MRPVMFFLNPFLLNPLMTRFLTLVASVLLLGLTSCATGKKGSCCSVPAKKAEASCCDSTGKDKKDGASCCSTGKEKS